MKAKVELAPKTRLSEYPDELEHLNFVISELLEGSALLTDKSVVSDFDLIQHRGASFSKKLTICLGIPVKDDDTFVDVVRKMAEKKNAQ